MSIAETEEEEEDANAKYKISCAMLDRLASFSLRDNTRETMYPVLLSLRIVLARLIEEALGEDEVLKEAIAFGAMETRVSIRVAESVDVAFDVSR